MYEIGLVTWYYGAADSIVGPFPDLESANKECSRRNKEEKRKLPPGHGSPGWMTACWKEIPRMPGCEIKAP